MLMLLLADDVQYKGSSRRRLSVGSSQSGSRNKPVHINLSGSVSSKSSHRQHAYADRLDLPMSPKNPHSRSRSHSRSKHSLDSPGSPNHRRAASLQLSPREAHSPVLPMSPRSPRGDDDVDEPLVLFDIKIPINDTVEREDSHRRSASLDSQPRSGRRKFTFDVEDVDQTDATVHVLKRNNA